MYVCPQAHPYVTRVVVLSSVSEHAHACQSAIELGVEAFQEYGQMLQQDVSDMREANAAMGSGPGPAPPAPAQHFSVTVKGMQMNICALDAGTFVLPAASAAATHARCVCELVHSASGAETTGGVCNSLGA